MASAPRPSARPRQAWRERSRPGATTAEAKLLKRWFWSLLFVLLVAALAWLIWRYLFMPRTYFGYLSVTEYKKHEAPPVPFFENDARFFDATIESQTLSNAETVASMKQLAASLDRIVSRSRDSLVLYVSAHGASFKSGGSFDGYLLCADFDTFKSEGDRGIARGYLKVTDFLNEVRNCQAGLKIVILDAGHLPTEPRLGVIVNEFPDRLAEAVKASGDENLWVLSANSMHESSHVAHASHQSVFSHLVVRGLAGDADVKPADGVVDLAELTSFVCGGVRDWMNRQYGELESQTPQILWGGGDITPAVVETRMHAIELPIVKVASSDDGKNAEGQPQEKSPAQEKPAADATARMSKPLPLERFARLSSSFGLLAAGAQAPPAAESAAPAVKPAEDAPKPETPAAADSKPDDAKKTPAEAAPPDAAKKDSPAAEATIPDAPAAKDPAAKQPPKPAAAAVEKEAPPDKWLVLRQAWTERDRQAQPEKDGGWTPIDYAPRVWRRYESVILDYEARRRDAIEKSSQVELDKRFEQDRAALLDDLQDARRDYLGSRRPADQSGPIREALQVRNRGFYRAIDLVAWHARASCARSDALREFPELVDFLQGLGQLDLLLAAAIAEPAANAVADGAGRLTALETRKNRVQSQLSALETGLKALAALAAKDADKEPITRGVARRIEDLLVVPLLDGQSRMALVEVLDRTGKWPPQSQLASAAAERDAAAIIGSQQATVGRQSGLKPPWSRAIEQAQLEARLVELADPAVAKKLAESIPPSADAIGSGSRKLRDLSERLAEYYRDLPGRIKQADSTTLVRSDRELRVFPFVESVVLKVNPVVELHWAAPAVRSFDFAEFDNKLELDPSAGWRDLSGALSATGGYTGEVQFTVNFDSSKLQVESADGDRAPVTSGAARKITFDAEHPSVALHFRVRRSGLQARAAAELNMTATSAEQPGLSKSRKILCEAPPPDDIELVVDPAPDANNPADDDERTANRALVSRTSAGPLVYTFPGHVTSFLFKLKHESPRERKVSVELLGVDETDPTRLAQIRTVARTDPGELIKEATRPRSKLKKLASIKELKLPASAALGTAIPFPAFPPTPAETKEPAKESKPPELPSIAGGLIAIVRDLDNPDRAAWVNWVRVSPWAPWHYVEPRVEYDGERSLSVVVRLAPGGARPQDGRPISVRWEESAEIAEDQITDSEAKLDRENQFRDQLEAQVRRDPKVTAEVRLNVDGYPRAFVYQVPLGQRRALSNDDRERNLESIKIVQPTRLDAFKSGEDKIPIRLQVSAPDTSFRPDDADKVEVGIDETGDGIIDDKLTSYADRKYSLAVKEIGSEGRISIDTSVTDLEFELLSPPLNKRAKLVARLALHDRASISDSVEVIFDRTPPTLEVEPRDPIVHRGETVKLSVTALDRDPTGAEASGVKIVNHALDKRKLDAQAKEKPKQIETPDPDSGKFVLVFEPPPDLPLGPHTLLFWANDNVGWESKPDLVTITVRDKRPPNAPTAKGSPGPTTGTIKGQVIYGKDPVANATVSIVEGTGATMVVKKSVQSDGSGQFAIKDLQPGEYSVAAQGRAKNGLRKAPPAPVSIPTPPKVVDHNVKLQ